MRLYIAYLLYYYCYQCNFVELSLFPEPVDKHGQQQDQNGQIQNSAQGGISTLSNMFKNCLFYNALGQVCTITEILWTNFRPRKKIKV
jgi:hypothetical protein